MQKTYFKSRPYLKFAMAAALAWTAGAVVSAGWNLKSQAIAVQNTARAAAKMAYEKDVVYRMWSSMHGGVYVPVSSYAEPNIYLKGVEDRDIETTDGKRLTLINPAICEESGNDTFRFPWSKKSRPDFLRPRPG